MNDLTSDFKSGRLKKNKHYYIKTDIDREFIKFYGKKGFKGIVKEVVAPVPSYEEFQALKSERDKFAYDLGVADTKKGELLRLLKKCQDVIKRYYSDYEFIDEQTESVLTKIEEEIKWAERNS